MKAKYPQECPVFDIDGQHYEMRPLFVGLRDSHEWVEIRGIAPVTYLGCSTYVPGEQRAKPLTRAARELLAWSRQ